MTWIDLVRKYFSNVSEKECDFILWEKTAFPFVSAETVEKQLQEYQVMRLAEKRNNYVREENIYQ